jgi:glycosyltransferase involved in cell wall biosynthesis
MIWVELVEALGPSGRDISFVVAPHPAFDPLVARAEAAGARCLARADILGTFDLAGKRRFTALLEGFRGIVHFNLNSLDACRHQIAAARGRPGVALVATAQDLCRRAHVSWWKRRRRRAALGALARVACLSRAIAEQVSAYRPADGVVVVPPLVPDATVARAAPLVGEAARAEARRRLGIPADARVAACVGVVAPHKNQRALVERLPALLAREPRLLLLLVGGDLRGLGGELVALAEAAGAGRALRWLGRRDDALEVLAACDLLVHPALAEGLGRVVQEAHLLGLPVVAYRSGGVPDVVVDEGDPSRASGVLVAPGDAGALCLAWLALLSDEGRRREMGARGRARVLERFGRAEGVAAYERLYEEVSPLLGRRSRAAAATAPVEKSERRWSP